ncbi:hypothetical protein MMC17_005838 [Xylographa soralifera]|nr:hypothetical protein [Xylographa soralifera]
MATKMTWDVNADSQLLLAIIAEQPMTLNFVAIAGRLGCSPRAVQERIKRLKKLAEGHVEDTAGTPPKRKKAAGINAVSKKRKMNDLKAKKSHKKKTAPVKEEKEAMESGEEGSLEDNTLVSIAEDDLGDEELTGTEAIREDMDIQMLLILQKICNQKAIKLPWDEVGAQLGGTITGGAIIQHLAKLRARRVEQGLPVPEPLKRGSGGGVTLSTGAVNGSGGARKGRQGKRPAASYFNTSNEDDEEEFDVDKASDPEASFGEVRKKRIKRDIEDGIEEDDSGIMAKPKGGQPNKNSKAAKRIQTNFLEDTRQNLKEESSPEASSATANKRAGRRSSVNYARLHNGKSEYDTDDEMNEPHVAAGSSFLKLEGVAPIRYKEESVTNHDEGENADDDEEVAEYEGEVSRGASVSLKQEDDDNSNITVLRLGKSERSLDFLKTLDSSYTSTAPLGYAASAVVQNVGNLPASFGRRASVDFDMSGVSRATTSNNLNHQYFPNANGMNFRLGHHSQYHTSPYANGFLGSSSAPYSSAMPEFMPLTPFTGPGFTGLPGEFLGTDTDNFIYPNPYGGGRSVPSMTAPQTPVIGGGFPGPNEYAPGGNFSNILPSRAPPSNSLLPSVLPSQILRSNDFSSLSNTRNNSMSTSATTNGQQNIQNFTLNNNLLEEIDFNDGEKLTNIYSFPTSEQQDPMLSFDTELDNDSLRGEAFGAVFNRFIG